MNENTLFKDSKELIFLMLGKGDFHYGKEVKIAKTLLKDFPDINFWRDYDPHTKIYSLSLFLTSKGREEIRKNYDMFLLTRPKDKIILSNVPVVNIPEVENKGARTLMELIDNVY
jgi:hypothetical protein